MVEEKKRTGSMNWFESWETDDMRNDDEKRNL